MSDEININLILHKLHKYQKKLENAERNGRENVDIYRQKIQFYYEQLGGGCSRLFGWSKSDKEDLDIKIQLMNIYIAKKSLTLSVNSEKKRKYHWAIILLNSLLLISDYTKKCNYFEKFNKYHFKIEAIKKVKLKEKPKTKSKPKPTDKQNVGPSIPKELRQIREHPANIGISEEYKINLTSDETTVESNHHELIELGQTPMGNDIIYDLPAFIAVVLLYIASNSNECITSPKKLLESQVTSNELKHIKTSMLQGFLSSNKECIIHKWFNLLQNSLDRRVSDPIINIYLKNEQLLQKICDYFAELINRDVKDYPQAIQQVKTQELKTRQLPSVYPAWFPLENNPGTNRKNTVFVRPPSSISHHQQQEQQEQQSFSQKRLTVLPFLSSLSLEDLEALYNDEKFLNSHRGLSYDEARLNISALKNIDSNLRHRYGQGMSDIERIQMQQVSRDPLRDFILSLIQRKKEERRRAML